MIFEIRKKSNETKTNFSNWSKTSTFLFNLQVQNTSSNFCISTMFLYVYYLSRFMKPHKFFIDVVYIQQKYSKINPIYSLKFIKNMKIKREIGLFQLFNEFDRPSKLGAYCLCWLSYFNDRGLMFTEESIWKKIKIHNY